VKRRKFCKHPDFVDWDENLADDQFEDYLVKKIKAEGEQAEKM